MTADTGAGDVLSLWSAWQGAAHPPAAGHEHAAGVASATDAATDAPRASTSTPMRQSPESRGSDSSEASKPVDIEPQQQRPGGRHLRYG